MPAEVLDQIAVLADPLRARTLAVLAGQELTVSELCDVLQLPQSTVSRHLKTLSDGGWVTCRREATSRYYSLAADELQPARRRLWLFVQEQVAETAEACQDDARLKGVLGKRRTKSERFFSSAAGQWDRVRAELFGTDSHLRALFGLFDPQWTLGDLGCGTGQAIEAFAPFVGKVIGIEHSNEMLQAARARLRERRNVVLRRGALERLPLDDQELDVAVMSLVLHHIPDPGSVLAEAARVLKPGGRLLLADMLPHEHEEYRQTMGHVWLGFSKQQVERWCTTAGFGALRWHALAVEPGVKGPGLFVATAIRRPFTKDTNDERGS